MNSEETERWRRCSSCKKDIAFNQVYWVCNVSTCNRKRTGTVFCTVSCCEAHVPIMRHRESWAVEKTAPTREAFLREQAGTSSSASSAASSAKATRDPKRTIVRRTPATSGDGSSTFTSASTASSGARTQEIPHDVLIVASKLKNYIKAVSGMNTSDAVLETLSDHVRALCDKAIRSAREHERRTVMDRDYPDP